MGYFQDEFHVTTDGRDDISHTHEAKSEKDFVMMNVVAHFVAAMTYLFAYLEKSTFLFVIFFIICLIIILFHVISIDKLDLKIIGKYDGAAYKIGLALVFLDYLTILALGYWLI